MAGFGDKFNVNTKCLVIAGGLAGLYWVAPQKNWWVVVAILFVGYIAIAWYDLQPEIKIQGWIDWRYRKTV